MAGGKAYVLAVLLFLLGLATLLPSHGSKPNMLGYYSVCSFSPVSTIILIVPGAVLLIIAGRKKRKEVAYGEEGG